MNFKKLFQWEYWPAFMFYIPNVPYAFLLALKAKSVTFFTAANPGMKHSGNGTESKFKTLSLFPSEFVPTSIFVEKGKNINEILAEVKAKNIEFPLIVKPDVGFRGLLVKKIHSSVDLKNYLKTYSSIDLLIQEYINLKNECGIFYHKLPGSKTGKITSITLKKYISVIGDGFSTLKELILKNERAIYYKDLLFDLHKKNINAVLAKDEERVLNVVGNHSKGTQFINGNHLISTDLEHVFNKLFANIPNVFYGRIDLKYDSFSGLIDKKGFKIIEMNGIISEPTHIYDSTSMTYFGALKEIRKHWEILYKIAVINNKQHQVEFEKPSTFVKSLIQLKKYTKKLNKL